jgi:outer membrane protein assembly factor BamC
MKHMNKAALAATLLALAGCSMLGFESKRVDYKAQAQRTPSLEVPPDLTVPNTEGRYTIPGSEGETVTRYSDYAHGTAEPVAAPQAVAGGPSSAPAQTVAVKATTPALENKARLERDGARRWLVVSDSAESIWPQLTAFWSDKGIKLVADDVRAGLMETEWHETRAKIEEGGIRGIFGKLADGMHSTGNRDMFRIRVERTQAGAASEVYVSHYGKEEVMDASGSTFKWQNRPSDVELEAATLQQLLASLNVASVRSSSVGSAGQAENAPAASTRMVEQADGVRTIELSDAFDKGWERVGQALDLLKLTIADKNRADGTYFVDTTKPEMRNLLPILGGGSKPEILHVSVRGSGKVTLVTVTSDEGTQSRAADRLFDKLYLQLK